MTTLGDTLQDASLGKIRTGNADEVNLDFIAGGHRLPQEIEFCAYGVGKDRFGDKRFLVGHECGPRGISEFRRFRVRNAKRSSQLVGINK